MVMGWRWNDTLMSGATAAWLGPVGSVALGGVGVLVVAGLWPRLFPALSRRDDLLPGGTVQPTR